MGIITSAETVALSLSSLIGDANGLIDTITTTSAQTFLDTLLASEVVTNAQVGQVIDQLNETETVTLVLTQLPVDQLVQSDVSGSTTVITLIDQALTLVEASTKTHLVVITDISQISDLLTFTVRYPVKFLIRTGKQTFLLRDGKQTYIVPTGQE